jgi:hypothetical protein
LRDAATLTTAGRREIEDAMLDPVFPPTDGTANRRRQRLQPVLAAARATKEVLEGGFGRDLHHSPGRLQDLLLAARTDPRKRLQTMLDGGVDELGKGPNPELLVDTARQAIPDVRERHQKLYCVRSTHVNETIL